MKKDDIVPLREHLKRYITKAYYLCDCNKTELAKRLDISVRTVKNYCFEFGLPTRRSKFEKIPDEVKPEIEHYPPYFDCMQPVTESERDEWYNRDYY